MINFLENLFGATTEQHIIKWREKYENRLKFGVCDEPIRGLSCFARYIGPYGFQMHPDFSTFGDYNYLCWRRLDKLNQQCIRQRHRKISGNWKTLWKNYRGL